MSKRNFEKAVIGEALEIADSYLDNDDPGLVNRYLDHLSNRHPRNEKIQRFIEDYDARHPELSYSDV